MRAVIFSDPTVNGGACVDSTSAKALPQPSGWGKGAPDLRHENGRKVRADALPEHIDYRDRGCSLAPTCLRCPLERCRYDEPGGARTLLQRPRDAAVRVRREEGVGIAALAAEFNISRRSVFRVLARGRAVNG